LGFSKVLASEIKELLSEQSNQHAKDCTRYFSARPIGFSPGSHRPTTIRRDFADNGRQELGE
jgi:hypothetical protein